MSVGCKLTLLKAMPMSEKVKRNITHINTIYDQTPQIKFGQQIPIAIIIPSLLMTKIHTLLVTYKIK